MLNILIEAVGSYTSGYLIDAIKTGGFYCIASDINKESAGAHRADQFVQFPLKNDPDLWEKVEQILVENNVNLVIPTFDEMLIGWGQRVEHFASRGIVVVTSPLDTLNTFQDKWLTYHAFKQANLPCPNTSLTEVYGVLKPRIGRGAVGIEFLTQEQQVTTDIPQGYLSQQRLNGEEYTVDCLFNIDGELVYCIPRKRLMVKEGKSTCGIVDMRQDIIDYIEQLARHYTFRGPINVQCFVDGDDIAFIEVNARFGGGSSLAIAATENWIPLLVDNFVNNKAISAQAKVRDSLKMYRQYRDVFDES